VNQPSLSAESARSLRHTGFRGLCRAESSGERAPSVVVSWVGTDAGHMAESQQIELAACTDSGVLMDSSVAWICRTAPFARWVQSLVESDCAEVLLTARVGESGVGRQAVLELAGFLTRELARSKPAIRVRFATRGRSTRAR
jgi:hypothetical protein